MKFVEDRAAYLSEREREREEICSCFPFCYYILLFALRFIVFHPFLRVISFRKGFAEELARRRKYSCRSSFEFSRNRARRVNQDHLTNFQRRTK